MSIADSYNRFIERLEFARLGFISMAILIDSALGGISLMFVLKNSSPVWELATSAGFPIANLVSCLVVESAKWVFNIFIFSAIASITLILFNAF